MVLSLLWEMKDLVVPLHKGDVIRDLEFAMRAKGGMSQEQEAELRAYSVFPQACFILVSGLSSYLGWFATGLGNKLAGLPPMHGLKRFGFSAGLAYSMGRVIYVSSAEACVRMILKSEDEHMKLQLANIILTKHSDDKPLVQAVKRHFFSEHVFDDLHQDKPLFRWHPRRSYVDGAFVERVKEIEASNSYDEGSFGNLMEDPFACILGSPGSGMESNISPEKTGRVLKRSELRARRRSHRHHHHRRADKLTAS